MEPSDATFHLQVYSTMAYGGRGIQYFTYFAPTVGNYRLAAIDQFGNRTGTWEMLRRINNEIHALAPTLIQLRSTGVYHYPDVPEQGPAARSEPADQVGRDDAGICARPRLGARFLIGEFEDQRGRPYFMIVNKDLAQSFRFRVELKREGQAHSHVALFGPRRAFRPRDGLAGAGGRRAPAGRESALKVAQAVKPAEPRVVSAFLAALEPRYLTSGLHVAASKLLQEKPRRLSAQQA